MLCDGGEFARRANACAATMHLCAVLYSLFTLASWFASGMPIRLKVSFFNVQNVEHQLQRVRVVFWQ